ncbi:MAG: thioredoxin family protein [Gammaproteobacteria bacterium]|nr:thioredoxin family protein [Gammaproteobacteria bacterium]MCP5425720.1 thioredoxin family protein [Gammaproteobacteria bacterium]
MIRYVSKTIATLITLIMFVAVILPVQATVAVGEAAPDFTAMDSNGISHKLSDLRGSTVVLEWTNHECPYTVKHYKSGNMQALQKDATGKGIVWLTVVSSAPGKQGYVTGEQANELTASRGASPTAVLLDPDGKIGRLYGARTTPHMYIIDPAGKLVYMGGIDDKPTADPTDIASANNYVREALSDMAAGKAIEHPTTRPYGCSVKY